MKKLILKSIIGILMLLAMGCSIQKPTGVDRVGNLSIMVVDTSRIFTTQKIYPIADARIRIINEDYNLRSEYYTDETGHLELNSLMSGKYSISADKKIIDYALNGLLEKEIYEYQAGIVDTLFVSINKTTGIVINEIFYCGSSKSKKYYSDQYIELYNNSNTIQYLDSLIVCRLYTPYNFPEGKIVSLKHYQFPGSGTDYPIFPGSFVVIALNAIDHTINCPQSIDLSHADWEFFNEYGNDIDNVNVPNLINLDSNDRTNVFMRLSADEICILKVSNWDDVIDLTIGNIYVKLFSVFDILDGVTYARNINYHCSLPNFIESGMAGININAYSGKSIERQNPETKEAGYDTNNSSFDFVTINRPTPGYQHQ